MIATYKYHGPNKAKDPVQLNGVGADLIWLARMCVGEGGMKCTRKKASAMMWSLMNRYFLHPGRKHWQSFFYLMRAFSQPINPRWAEGGDLARRYAGTKYATPARLKRREYISTLSQHDIPHTIRSAVHDFSRGELFPPDELAGTYMTRISNWASHKFLNEKYPWGVNISGDWFFEDENLVRGCVVVDRGEG
jgi:hypothetical protein